MSLLWGEVEDKLLEMIREARTDAQVRELAYWHQRLHPDMDHAAQQDDAAKHDE